MPDTPTKIIVTGTPAEWTCRVEHFGESETTSGVSATAVCDRVAFMYYNLPALSPGRMHCEVFGVQIAWSDLETIAQSVREACETPYPGDADYWDQEQEQGIASPLNQW